MTLFNIIILLCIFTALRSISSNHVSVQVKQGKLLGARVKTVTGVEYNSFKGIPYAKPPVGKLRFKAPQDPEPWDGERNATEHGSTCPQLLFKNNLYIPGSEDCLFLNVYTPNTKPDKLFPVIVVIHGGAFKFGSGNVDLYGPDFLVAQAVVVTFNFRLNTLGLLCLGNCEVPGNAALKDQVAALKWVQANINKFGGDANCVTIIGGTSGAASVTYHLISPMSKGLFHRAIATSGSLFVDSVSSYQPERRALVQAQSLGYKGKSSTELLDFYQNIHYEKLINTNTSTAAILASEEKTLVPFKLQPFSGPVVEKECPEGNFITKDPLEILKSGKVNKADVMFSYNSQEGLILVQEYADMYIEQYKRYPELFVPTKILINSTGDIILKLADKIIKHYFGDKEVSVENMPEFINYASNASVVYDVQRFYKKWPRVGNKYILKFTSHTSRNFYGKQGVKYGIVGASHFDDLCYVFDPKSLNLTLNTDGVEYKIIKMFTQSIINFAKYGKPTSNPSIWPQYSSSYPANVIINEDMTVEYAADEDEYNFWKSVFDIAGIEF